MRIAIVTGASSGLGAEFVRQIDRKYELGEIWVVARRRDRLEELGGKVGTPVRVLPLDLTEESSIDGIAHLLEDERPDVRILVNAAGFGKIGSWKDISASDVAAMIDLNCRAAVLLTQAVLPYMGKGSTVLEICSTAAFQPFQYLNVYAASKAFLYRYSRALRVELFGSGISVTAVCPYWIRDTEFIGTARENANGKRVRHFVFSSREKSVVRWALVDAGLRIPVSTPGPVCLVHRIAAKYIPHGPMMAIWALLRRV